MPVACQGASKLPPRPRRLGLLLVAMVGAVPFSEELLAIPRARTVAVARHMGIAVLPPTTVLSQMAARTVAQVLP